MRIKTTIATAAALFVTLGGVALAADTLTINVKIHATALDPASTGVRVECATYLDAAHTQHIGTAADSPTVARTAAGTADGTVAVQIKDWDPKAKYWKCDLMAEKGAAVGYFNLPTAPTFAKADPWRKAASGVLSVQGVVP